MSTNAQNAQNAYKWEFLFPMLIFTLLFYSLCKSLLLLCAFSSMLWLLESSSITMNRKIHIFNATCKPYKWVMSIWRYKNVKIAYLAHSSVCIGWATNGSIEFYDLLNSISIEWKLIEHWSHRSFICFYWPLKIDPKTTCFTALALSSNLDFRLDGKLESS